MIMQIATVTDASEKFLVQFPGKTVSSDNLLFVLYSRMCNPG